MVGIVQLGFGNSKTSDSAPLFPVCGVLVAKRSFLCPNSYIFLKILVNFGHWWRKDPFCAQILISSLKYASCKTLTCLRKLCLTFWTSNADTSFSLRNTNLLITGRTFINMMCFALLHN